MLEIVAGCMIAIAICVASFTVGYFGIAFLFWIVRRL